MWERFLKRMHDRSVCAVGIVYFLRKSITTSSKRKCCYSLDCWSNRPYIHIWRTFVLTAPHTIKPPRSTALVFLHRSQPRACPASPLGTFRRYLATTASRMLRLLPGLV